MSENSLAQGALLREGAYEIVRFIAAGGFGCTYEAYDKRHGRRVAIKEFFVRDFCMRDAGGRVCAITKDRARTIGALKRKFMDEAHALRGMDHPGVVRVHDVFEGNGTAYYVMDYIEGPTLAQMIKGRMPMTEAEALNYIRQTAEALAYVHSCGRLHLDVKPENIMVGGDGHVVLIDFGVSKVFDEDGVNTSRILGATSGYASLEQQGNNVDLLTRASDVYSLGATFYSLLTGKVPPEAGVIASGAQIEWLPTYVTQATNAAITAAMQPVKDARPQTVEAFVDMLPNNVMGVAEAPIEHGGVINNDGGDMGGESQAHTAGLYVSGGSIPPDGPGGHVGGEVDNGGKEGNGGGKKKILIIILIVLAVIMLGLGVFAFLHFGGYDKIVSGADTCQVDSGAVNDTVPVVGNAEEIDTSKINSVKDMTLSVDDGSASEEVENNKTSITAIYIGSMPTAASAQEDVRFTLNVHRNGKVTGYYKGADGKMVSVNGTHADGKVELTDVKGGSIKGSTGKDGFKGSYASDGGSSGNFSLDTSVYTVY